MNKTRSDAAREKLVKALTEANAPQDMIAYAQLGGYGDFTSESATPITDLVMDCAKFNLHKIKELAMNGEYDG
jgi:hypothetical protein